MGRRYRNNLVVSFAGILICVSLAGCASLGGSPERVVSVNASVNLAVNTYRIDRALAAFDEADDHRARQGQTRKQYRDMVVSVYLNAADARYDEWRSRLSDERRELGLGFDSAVIGLTGLASVARQTLVRSFSAAASIMAGTHGAVDRNIYFDRTLPGLLASMDAQRLRIRADILRHLDDTPENYPLATAFADISSYESAGSIDRAIEEITAQAAAERHAAQQEYNSAVHACHVTEDVSTNRGKIWRWVTGTGRTAADLERLARQMGADSSALPSGADPVAAWRERIRHRIDERYCTNAELEAVMASANIK